MFLKKALVAISFLMGSSVALAAPVEVPKKLTMATSADYPPYEFHDTSGGEDKIVGFDIDIANFLAKDLGFELKINDVDFNGLLPALQSKRADFVMAGMTPTPERKKNAEFSNIYYNAKNTIVALKDKKLTKEADLKGKKVGVQLGTIQEKEAKEMKGIEVVPLNRIGDIIQELKSKRIDAAIIEDAVAKGYIEQNKDLQFTVIPPKGPNGSAVAFPKGSKLPAAFNESLRKLKESGELDKLIKKWFEDYTPAKK